MTQNRNFILFNLSEFGQWLNGLQLNRKIKVIQNQHTWLPEYITFTGKRVKEGTGNTKTCPGTNFFKGNRIENYTQYFLPKVAAQIQRIS